MTGDRPQASAVPAEIAAAGTEAALVIGGGAIGHRHAGLLRDLGLQVDIISRREGQELSKPALDKAGYVVVATETADHLRVLNDLAALDFRGAVLVEKPLLSAPGPMPPHRFRRLAVGYQLRFLPVVKALMERLGGGEISSAQLYVGQHLSQWRPGRDWRQGYSAKTAAGGGVLRDLSHEIDLALLVFGPCRRLTALTGREGLGLEAEDSAALLLRCERCPVVSLEMNMVDRRPRRRLVVQTAAHSYEADLINGTLAVDDDLETFAADRDEAMREMHRSVLSSDAGRLYCDETAGLAVVGLIAAAEKAARDGIWVTP